MMLVDHDIEADLVTERELVEIAVEKAVADIGIEIAVRQHNPERSALHALLPGGMIGHFREVPDAHGSPLLTSLFDKGREALDEGFGLLPMREVAGLRDDFEPGTWHRLTPAFAVLRSDDPIVCAPQQQRRNVDPVQPPPEPRIVHVGLPAIERESFASADDLSQFGVPKLREIDVALRRITPGQLQVVSPRQRIYVGNISLSRPPILMPSGSTKTRCENRAVDRTIISAAIQPPKQAPTSTALSSFSSVARSR